MGWMPEMGRGKEGHPRLCSAGCSRLLPIRWAVAALHNHKWRKAEVPERDAMRPVKRQRHPVAVDSSPGSGSDSDSDGDFVSDLREIACLLRLIKSGANEDEQKMCQQVVSSVAADIQTMLEDTKLKFEKERQNLLKVLSSTSKECESSLNEEYTKLQETYEMFSEEKDAQLQSFKDLFLQVEVEKKELLEQYEHYRKEETATLSELGDTFSEKIADVKSSPKRMKQVLQNS
uniref:Uncharacterized protein n=1 Tax=Avena sativa TaxID=4498 RepID=A0ACD5XDC9_AVESA